MPPDTLPVLLLALCIDAAASYPDWLFKRVGHPVTWIGALIAALDRTLNRDSFSARARMAAGVVALLLVLIVSAGAAALVQSALRALPFGWVMLAFAASSLLASRSLFDHVADVASALETSGLDAGRCMVSRIVGRDPNALDAHGVARAAIESLAENASDGVVAPAFWFALLGLPGLVAYKAINTADSMIGHRTPRYEAFGWAAARLDDVVNLPASRLTAAFFVAAAFLTGASAGNATRAVLRDARRHRSPNAGWPEAAMAGALGLKLAGPRTYAGVLIDDAAMGDGRSDATVNDIKRALRLAKAAWVVLCSGVAVSFIAAGASIL